MAGHGQSLGLNCSLPLPRPPKPPTLTGPFTDPLTHPACPSLCPRPLILDPADPSWNVAQGNWELLAQEAAALRTQTCLLGPEGTPVSPWDVMVRRGPTSCLGTT